MKVIFLQILPAREVIFMAVAHKGSISMGMVLIPIGLYKKLDLWSIIDNLDNMMDIKLLRYQNNSYYSDVLVIPINTRNYLHIKHSQVQIS